jgi:hypothetical protein
VITIRVQGELRGKKLERCLSLRGWTYQVTVDDSRARWRTYTLKVIADPRTLRRNLEREMGDGALSVSGPPAERKADWQVRAAARERETREEKVAQKGRRTSELRASGRIEFSVLGGHNKPTVEAVLNTMPGGWTVRRGGARWVYCVQCPLSEDAFQDWLNRTFPQVVCKVVRV